MCFSISHALECLVLNRKSAQITTKKNSRFPNKAKSSVYFSTSMCGNRNAHLTNKNYTCI